ncbi:MAG: S9 family peptidase, partial [bacterium]
PNPKAVAFLAPQDPRYSFSQVEIYVVELGSRRTTKLSSDIDLGIEEFAWSSDSRSLIVDVEAGTQSALYRLSLADLSIDPILTGAQYISALSGKNDKLAVVFETAATAPEIGLVQLDGRALDALTKVNELDAEIELPTQRVITYRSTENAEIEAVLWEPVGVSSVAKYPAVLELHGGPDDRTTNTMFNRLPQYLAANGYVVLSPNYRGSQGYYAEFNVANVNDLGGRDYQDVMAGVDYLEALGYVDPDAIGITGGSYGGYLTNWAISQSNRFAAAVSAFGIFNFFTDYGGSEFAYWEREYLGEYWEDDSIWLARSPSSYAAQITTPVLIMHGEEDPNTFITNSMEMYRALLDMGRTVEFVKLPREGHGFDEPQHRVIEMEWTLDWFDRYLQPSRSFAVSGEIVSSKTATLTFMSAQKMTLKRLPPPEGQYVLLRLELSSRASESPTLSIDDDFMLVTPDYQRCLASGLLVQSQLVTGASIELRREVFTPEIIFDLPKDATEATLRVEGFAPLRIRF